MAIISAKEARQRVESTKRTLTTSAVVRYNALIQAKVAEAIENNLLSVSIETPGDIDDTTLEYIREHLTSKLGYTTKVDRRYGFMATNLYVEPKRILKLFW